MEQERSADVIIGGKTYALTLTTRATKEIAARYGGLEKLGDKLLKNDDFEKGLGEVVWLLTLLANQTILISNLQSSKATQPLLTEEAVELLTSPAELATYKEAITQAMLRGTKRDIESEKNTKNAAVG